MVAFLNMVDPGNIHILIPYFELNGAFWEISECVDHRFVRWESSYTFIMH